MMNLPVQLRCFAYCLSLVNIAFGSRLRQTEEIYRASSTLDWTIITPNPAILSTTELFNLESSCAKFFEVEIKSALSEVQILAVDFDVIDQSILKDALQYRLVAYLTITYGGEFIGDYSKLLYAVVTNEKMNELIHKEHEIFHSSSMSVYSSFSVIQSFLLGSTDDGATGNAVLAIVLIAISCMLATIAAALFYQSEYCRCRCKQAVQSSHGIKLTLTQESGSEANDSVDTSTHGKLGANKQADDGDNSIVPITPKRGINHEYDDETPFSQGTFQTNVSDTSITSRDPLGIVSMNTLSRLLYTPQAKKDTHSKALYDVALSDDES